MAGNSRIGAFFRRIANYFDGLGTQPGSAAAAGGVSPSTSGSSHAPHLRGSRTEIDIITFGVLGTGILVLGTAIHGWGFFFWSFLFAVFFCGGAWLIFRSIAWQPRQRNILLSLLLVLAVPSAAQRFMPFTVFAFLCAVLLVYLAKRLRQAPGEIASAAAVILFCFVSYDVFSAVVENRRNAVLQLAGHEAVSCRQKANRTICNAESVAFHVPEFWRKGTETSLVADLSHVAPLTTYADSATKNTLAFAAFKSTPEQLVRSLGNFLYTQKGFLKSRGLKGETLTLQQVMRGADAELYAVNYMGVQKPEYLGEKAESHALLLLHVPNATRAEGRDQTWLFVIDGPDLTAREFMLHRILSGFHSAE